MNSVNSLIASPSSGTKIVFLVHFIGTVGATQYGLPLSYLFYNSFMLLCLLWSLAHKELEDPLLLAGCINALAILFDAFIIGAYYDSLGGFTILCAILNLLLRPITTIFIVSYYNERSDAQINIPGFTSPSETQFGNGRSSYESIDRQTSRPAANTGGTTFA